MTLDRVIAVTTVTALTAVTLLALKSRFINRRLVALARQFRLHHFMALIAGAGMLIHTVLAFWRDWPDSLTIYFTPTDFPTLAGWTALFCFAIVISSSWIGRLSWKRWYLLHLLSLPGFIMLGSHALIYARTRPVDSAILIVFFVLLVAALVRALIDRFSSANSREFRVVENRAVAEGIFELHLESQAGRNSAEFPAGSIVYLRFVGPRFSRQWHPFSVASCRHEADLRLLIKGLGADTVHLPDLREADMVLIRGPFREFTPDFAREQIWIAGGIGIAPFAGYAACLAHYQHGRVQLFHFFEREEQKLSLTTYAGKMPIGFSEIIAKTPPHTRPDLTSVLSAAKAALNAQFIVCGPPLFMRYVRRTLRHAGIDAANIETEEFLPW